MSQRDQEFSLSQSETRNYPPPPPRLSLSVTARSGILSLSQSETRNYLPPPPSLSLCHSKIRNSLPLSVTARSGILSFSKQDQEFSPPPPPASRLSLCVTESHQQFRADHTPRSLAGHGRSHLALGTALRL